MAGLCHSRHHVAGSSLDSLEDFNVLNIDDESEHDYILKVDQEYPF